MTRSYDFTFMLRKALLVRSQIMMLMAPYAHDASVRVFTVRTDASPA